MNIFYNPQNTTDSLCFHYLHTAMIVIAIQISSNKNVVFSLWLFKLVNNPLKMHKKNLTPARKL